MASSRNPDQPVILLVEDDPLVRAGLADILFDSGCRVLEAAHVGEACRLLSAREDIEVMIVDADLDGTVSGLDFARQARARSPILGLLVTTADTPPAPSAMPSDSRYLPLPVPAADLVRQVWEVVNWSRLQQMPIHI